MDLVKERDTLLRKLLQKNSIPDYGEYGGQQESRFKEYRNALLYHKFMDPFPEDVEKEWESLEGRVANAGQYVKKDVLGRLSGALLVHADAGNRNRAMWLGHDVGAGGSDLHHGQIDYWHRALLLLLRLSGNVEGSYVDVENAKRILKACGQIEKGRESEAQKHMLKLLLETGYQDDEDDAWWRESLVYSSGDELSDWSDNGDGISSDGGLASLEKKEGGIDTKGIEEEVQDADDSLEEATTRDAIDEKINKDAVAYIRNRIRPVKRRLRNQGMLKIGQGSDVVGGLKYEPTSLSVWLASKYCRSHLSDALNTRYCIKESDFLKQAMNCLRGIQNPGFAFYYDKNKGYRMKNGVHTMNVSVGALKSQADLVLNCANAMHRLSQYTHKVRCLVQSVRIRDQSKNSNSMLEAFAAAVDRQIQSQRNSLEMSSSLVAMHEGILPRLEPFCRVLLKICREDALQEEKLEMAVKTLIDSLQIKLKECQLQCSSGENVSVLGCLAEIFYSTLLSFVTAMDNWISFGSLDNAPLEFCIKERSTRNSQRSGNVFVLHPCPALFESCIQEFFTIGVAFSVSNRNIDDLVDSGKLREAFVNIVGAFNGGFANCFSQGVEDDECMEASIHPHSYGPSVIFRREKEPCWADEWIKDIAEHQHELNLQSGLNGFLPSVTELNQAQKNSFVPSIQCEMDVRMHNKSKFLYNKIKAKTRDAWYWTSTDQSNSMEENEVEFASRLKHRVLHKIETIGLASQMDAFESAESIHDIQKHSHYVESNLALHLALENTASICSKGRGMKKHTRNLVDQIKALRFLANMKSPIWQDFVCNFVECCSSRSGLDAMAVSNLNTLISEAMDVEISQGCSLRKAVTSAWLEHEEHSVDAFHDRNISYIKNSKWILEIDQPLKAMVDQEACDVIGDLRDLFLQILWVWATLSAAKKRTRRRASNISKASHATLFLSVTILRSIIQSTREYIDMIFNTCAEEAQACQRLGDIKTALDKAIKAISEGELSYNTPFRDCLEKWLDSLLRYGILILRADEQKWKPSDMMPSDVQSLTLSPSKESFAEALDAATHDVRSVTSSLLSALEKEAHASAGTFPLRFQDLLTSITFDYE